MQIEYINVKERKLNLENISINGFSNLSQIYSFTTENISGYFDYLNFKDREVLTVAASGDQIINAFYMGAKKVIGFDVNFLALLYTELKLVAIQNLEYKNFLSFFMINEENDVNKNKYAFDYTIYKTLRKHLKTETANCWDIIYQNFEFEGYKLRNSNLFNNKYDKNSIKINSNPYLRDEKAYNNARKKIKDKVVKLINTDYRNIVKINLSDSVCCDIILMSNISDYIKNIYNEQSDYLQEYLKDIINIFKNKTNKVVCAYLYDIMNANYRSKIDNPIYRKEELNKLHIEYEEKSFKSVIPNCIDSVIII